MPLNEYESSFDSVERPGDGNKLKCHDLSTTVGVSGIHWCRGLGIVGPGGGGVLKPFVPSGLTSGYPRLGPVDPPCGAGAHVRGGGAGTMERSRLSGSLFRVAWARR